jgi:3-methyl-2-oxobutanoate hydroxymethyltransferase
MAHDGDKIAVLTCYDASFAAVLETAGVEVLLVGDSLGMVLQGHDTTLPVTLRDMEYHTAAVARGSKRAFIIADMPFGTFQASPGQTFENAAKLLAAGAQMVKLEGGTAMLETVAFLTARGVPVCGHLGLTPQSVHQFGGYRLQGKGEHAAEQLLAEALQLQEAGAGILVLELVPSALAREISAQLLVPTIGIGAGVDCDGQVLVLHDMLDIFPGRKPKFVKNFLRSGGSIEAAIAAYVHAVKSKAFPGSEHSF